MREQHTEVLVVGAGPVGLAIAISLAQQHVDHIIIDALPVAQNTSRAAVVHSATLESLRPLVVTDDLIARGIKARNFRIRDRNSVLLGVDFSRLPTAYPFALMIPQDETEAILTERVQALGGTIRRPVRLTGVERTLNGVRVTCGDRSAPVVINARYLVGTDGEKSVVRASAGIAFPGDSYGSFLLADVRMSWPLPLDEVTLFFSKAGTLVVAPMSQNRHRVVAQLPNAPANPAISDVQQLLDARGPLEGAAIREIIWGSRFQVHHKLAARFHDGPVVLAGDAAHVHSPAGGQGMNLGLRDAVALGGALSEALASGSNDALTAYAAERRTAAARMLSMTDRLTRLATLQNPAVRWARNGLIVGAGTIPAVRELAARTLAGFQ